jgi:hypothetical protein
MLTSIPCQERSSKRESQFPFLERQRKGQTSVCQFLKARWKMSQERIKESKESFGHHVQSCSHGSTAGECQQQLAKEQFYPFSERIKRKARVGLAMKQ